MSSTNGRTDQTLKLVDVSVRYGVVAALDRVSVEVRAGEIAAVMGPNGAGKSTVLKAVMGLAPVVEGDVFWRGAKLVAATHQIVKQGIAFVAAGQAGLHPPDHRGKPGDGLPLPQRPGREAAPVGRSHGAVSSAVPETSRPGQPDVGGPAADARLGPRPHGGTRGAASG